MSFDPHSHRFNRRRLFPPIENDEEEMFGAPDLSPFSLDKELTSGLTERDIDLALELVALERCCVCPLCGAIVGSEGTVLS